jgi:hypothetical protein
MGTGYSSENLNNLGGWEAILNGLRDKFGDPDATSKGIQEFEGKKLVNYEWTITNACRSFSFYYTEKRGSVSISVKNTKF